MSGASCPGASSEGLPIPPFCGSMALNRGPNMPQGGCRFMRLRLILLALVCAVSLMVFAGSAAAIIGGTLDTTHTYVGLEHNGVFVCSGTLIRPRVLVTAVYCFSDTNSIFSRVSQSHPLAPDTVDLL